LSRGFAPAGEGLRNNGTLLWSRPSGDRSVLSTTYLTPWRHAAIGDVDADGQNDVVWGAADYKVYFVNGSSGASKPNWPRTSSTPSSPLPFSTTWTATPAEIIVGVDAHADGTFGT
jgi:hypothetical protein